MPRVPLGEVQTELLRRAKRATCHQGEGSLQCPPFNLPILPGQNGRVKNDCVLKLRLLFALIGPRGARGRRGIRAFMMSRRLGRFPRQRVGWNNGAAERLKYREVCLAINSKLFLPLHFFLLHFLPVVLSL